MLAELSPPRSQIETAGISSIPNQLYWNRFDPAKHIRFHPVHLSLEFFSLFARAEHQGVVHLPGSQLFAFPKGIGHICKYSSLHFYKHKGHANVSVERALFFKCSYCARLLFLVDVHIFRIDDAFIFLLIRGPGCCLRSVRWRSTRCRAGCVGLIHGLGQLMRRRRQFLPGRI